MRDSTSTWLVSDGNRFNFLRLATTGRLCCAAGHSMVVSSFAEGGYQNGGFRCDKCGGNKNEAGESGRERWFCHPCSADFCFACHPKNATLANAATTLTLNGVALGRGGLAAVIGVPTVLRADELAAVSVGPTFAETARSVSFYTTRDRVVATWRDAKCTHAVASWSTSLHAASPSDGAATTRFHSVPSLLAYDAPKTELHAPGLCFDAANALVWAYNATSRTVSCWASVAPRGDVWEGGASSSWSLAPAPSQVVGAAGALTMVVTAQHDGGVTRFALDERGAAIDCDA